MVISIEEGSINEINGNLDPNYKPNKFLKYFEFYKGGNTKPYRKTCKRKTRKRNNIKSKKVIKTKKNIKLQKQ